MRQHTNLHDFAASASLDSVASHIIGSLAFANPCRATRLATEFTQQRSRSEVQALVSHLRASDIALRVAARLDRSIH